MYNYLSEYIERLQSMGRYTFAWPEVTQTLEQSELALKKSLHRLIRKGRLVALQREFYLIVPPEYSARGIMPPLLFLDDYMSHLNKPYYVGLLSAAAMHGAAHQQPQEFFIVIPKPAKRSLKKKGIQINFFVKSDFPEKGIIQKKTDTGTVRLSSPELTAYDLVYYHERLGGLVRCISVLEELAEGLNPQLLADLAIEKSALASWQRLGYILENILGKRDLADAIHGRLQMRIRHRFPMEPNKIKTGFSSANRWMIIENHSGEAES